MCPKPYFGTVLWGPHWSWGSSHATSTAGVPSADCRTLWPDPPSTTTTRSSTESYKSLLLCHFLLTLRQGSQVTCPPLALTGGHSPHLACSPPIVEHGLYLPLRLIRWEILQTEREFIHWEKSKKNYKWLLFQSFTFSGIKQSYRKLFGLHFTSVSVVYCI